MKRQIENFGCRQESEEHQHASLYRDVKLKRQRLSALLRRSSSLSQNSLADTCFRRIEAPESSGSKKDLDAIETEAAGPQHALPKVLVEVTSEAKQLKTLPIYTLDNCNEVLDLSTKPASVRQHIGVSEATLALGHAPLSQTPFRKTTPPNRPVTPHFHMAPYMATRPHRPPVTGYDIGATNSGNSCTNSGTSYTNSGNSCTDSSSGSTCRAKASDGVISSSSRDSHEWQKYVTGSRYSPVSGYGSATGSGSGNSTSNSPFSSARSSPCREMMADARPVVNWTHLEKVKLMQEATLNHVADGSRKQERETQSCDICNDRATGLHYGIVSCEGCKGFFKRTVQNKRVYRCASEGRCQVNKLRRNRCQYCRFQKCLDKGMVLAAVRDDRMPGGRNSGAVYNLYKVKQRQVETNILNRSKVYTANQTMTHTDIVNNNNNNNNNNTNITHTFSPVYSPVNKPVINMLEVSHRLRLEQLLQCEINNGVVSSKVMSGSNCGVSGKEDLVAFSQRITETCVKELYCWVKSLPFYAERTHSDMKDRVSRNWYAISLLTSVCQRIVSVKPQYRKQQPTSTIHLRQRTGDNIAHLMANMKTLLGRGEPSDEVLMTPAQQTHLIYWIQVITSLSCNIEIMAVSKSEYVCMKVILLLSQDDGSCDKQEDYVDLLRRLVNIGETERFDKLVAILQYTKTAAESILDGQMMYLPFLMN